MTAKPLLFASAMTFFAAGRSTQHTIVVVGVILALLALPFLGVLHCQIMHDNHGHASTPLTEVCCVFLCFTALVGLAFLPYRMADDRPRRS